MTTDYSTSMDPALTAGMAGAMAIYYIICLVIGIVAIIAMWKIFTKAGRPGWASIIPFYNTYCLFDIAMGNGWLFFLTLVPCVNLVFTIMLYVKLAKAFGHGVGFALGLIFLSPIFLLILGFGDSQYHGAQ